MRNQWVSSGRIHHCVGGIVIACCWLAPGLPAGLAGQAQTPKAAASAPLGAVQAHLGKGYELLQNADYQGAAQEFQAALAFNPGLGRVRFQLAVCYYALHKTEDARREFERLRQETGGDPAVLYYLARLDLQEEKAASAIRLLDPIASDAPFPDTPYYLGTAYLRLGNLPAAEKWLKKAESATPRDWRVSDRLARVYIKEERRPEAEKEFAASSALRQAADEASQQGWSAFSPWRRAGSKKHGPIVKSSLMPAIPINSRRSV